MNKMFIFALLVMVMFLFTACVAGPNEMINSENEAGRVAGFWQGLWHGIIAPITFVVSLFNKNVGVYEVHNNDGWYNFGFIFGVMIIFGGGGGGGKRACSWKRG